jgi:glucosamine-6-phosphate deaminase
VTIPAIVGIPKLFLAVPGARKRKAVEAALQGPLTTACPASILRNHPEAHLFLDQDSFNNLSPSEPGICCML